MTNKQAIKYFENGINTNLRLKEKDKFAAEIANENIEAYSMAVAALSGDVRPNIHAHWKLVNPLQSDDGGAYCCSNCGSGIWGIIPRYWKGCPWCLAIMDEEPEGEESENV